METLYKPGKLIDQEPMRSVPETTIVQTLLYSRHDCQKQEEKSIRCISKDKPKYQKQ